MKITGIITKIAPISTYININKTMADALKLMADKNIEDLLIEENDKLVGTLTAENTLVKLVELDKQPTQISMKDVMLPASLYCYELDEIDVLLTKAKSNDVMKCVYKCFPRIFSSMI